MSGIPSKNVITGQADGFNSGVGGHASGAIPKGYGSSGMGSTADDFNAGLGGHASGAIPQSHRSSNEPTVSGAYSSGHSSNALTGSDGARTTGAGVGYGGQNLSSSDYSSGQTSGSHGIVPALAGGGMLGTAGLAGGHGLGHKGPSAGPGDGMFGGTGSGGIGGGSSGRSAEPVSGAYQGGSTSNALTGESDARTTGPGVGYDGTNLHKSRDSALSSTAGGALAGAGVAGVAGAGAAAYGTGVGASGGSGGHYIDRSENTIGGGGMKTGETGGAGIYEAQRASAQGTHGTSGMTSTENQTASKSSGGQSGDGTGEGGGAGKYGHASEHEGRGEPVMDPREIDSGGRHGLVFNKGTGKYEHRHILDEKK